MKRVVGQPLSSGRPRKQQRRSRFTRFFTNALIISTLALVLLLVGGIVWVVLELRSNANQGRILAEFSSLISYRVEPGPNPNSLPPDRGPHDVRLGYALLPSIQERMQDAGFDIAQQGRLSRRHEELVTRGVYYIYREKAQAGLELLDQNGQPLHRSRYPRQIYEHFDEVPDLVLRTVSFIEDRELLDFSHPYRNPVIDWERLARAVVLQALKSAGLSDRSIGASTVATQLEKLQHTPGGITHNAADKARQMVSAVLRAYQDGPDTLQARRRLALAYLNSLPLAARAGFGEVNGLADGITVWYGGDFARMNAVLADDDAPLELRALYFKQVLSLVLAIRRPALYLANDRTRLDALTNSYLRVMAAEQYIPADLAQAALATTLQRNSTGIPGR
ncbi:MAG: transglycosylase domain-containing protein, partial [Halioglobus sp.]